MGSIPEEKGSFRTAISFILTQEQGIFLFLFSFCWFTESLRSDTDEPKTKHAQRLLDITHGFILHSEARASFDFCSRTSARVLFLPPCVEKSVLKVQPSSPRPLAPSLNRAGTKSQPHPFFPSFIPLLYPPSSLLLFKLEGVDYPCPCGRTSPYATFQPAMKIAKNRQGRWVIISKWHNCLAYCTHSRTHTPVKNVPSHQRARICTGVT